MNRTKLNKTNKRISTFTYLYIISAWLYIEEETYKHLAHTSQMQKEIASFKQNARIFV